MSESRLTRRELLKKAGIGAAAVGVSGATAPYAFAGPMKFKNRHLKGDLSIIQWVHFVPDYDTWFDNTWVKQWGEKNDVQVKVEHINNTLLDTRAAAEVAAQSGHDLFFNLHPMASYEDQVINHAPIIKEIERKVGKYGLLGKQSTYNPKTKKYFAVSDNYVPDPVVWRRDLWNGVGEAPFTWDHVRKAAPKLKAAGHPIGIGQSQELDSNMALMAFMMCFGSFVQNAGNRPTLNSKSTIDAVKFMTEIYKSEDSAIFGWNPASNNNYLYSGTASMILNAISATRTPESQHLPFSDDLAIWPIPHGPHGRLGLEHVMGCYSIWKFAQNKENAQQFLVDLCVNGKAATDASQLYNFPSFPGAYPFKAIRKTAAADTHKPRGKYTVLTTIAEKYTHNIGYPGTTNAAMDEVFSKYLIPQMFAQVSQGKMSAADSVKSTNAAVKDIYAKWKERGKI
ncbi:MAG: multiple sugar transport system substrate-binding protein [Gaiellaceae bacterium]|nr:multiple sugar transport system substrate-binding protein [Gaiellaceae bacterium]